jgi:hypothetical protein
MCRHLLFLNSFWNWEEYDQESANQQSADVWDVEVVSI